MSEDVSTVPGDKTICLPIGDEVEYETLVQDRQAFRQYLDQQIAQHPELFPSAIEAGYGFHGFRTSAKLGLVSRRIRLVANGEAYQLRPDFVMPTGLATQRRWKRGYLYASLECRLRPLPRCWGKTRCIGIGPLNP